MISLFCISCNAQNNETKQELKAKPNSLMEQPKGSWKVDKEFDEKKNIKTSSLIICLSNTEKRDAVLSATKKSSCAHPTTFRQVGKWQFVERYKDSWRRKFLD